MMKLQLSLLLVMLLSNHFSRGMEVLCPPKWTQWRGACYRFVNQERKSWDDAETACKNYDLSQQSCSTKTAHLVTIDSKEENDFLFSWWKELRDMLPQKSQQSFWIGLNDKKNEGKFVSVEGKPAVYFNWSKRQPDNGGPNNEQDCVQVWKSQGAGDIGEWDDSFCYRELAFICESRCYFN